MDTEFDFLTPEFFYLLFFQQKNLIIYPYVDMKHIHSLDIFTLGYEAIDIDSVALHNLEDILNYELNNSYSQNTPFYFILNATVEHIEQLLESKNIHCVINTSENVASLANGSKYIFFNKKNKLFLNYDFSKVDLTLENEILQRAHNKHELIDEIFKIKNAASKIFSSINSNSSGNELPTILSAFKSSYWDKILEYTQLFYDIAIPEIPKTQIKVNKTQSKPLIDYSHEYTMILKSNKKIGQEFIQSLHEYRYRKVNPANLEIEQLYYPAQLYKYLRNHHWKQGIPQDFIDEWVLMRNTRNSLTEEDLFEFKKLFQKLKMNYSPAAKDGSHNQEKPVQTPKNSNHPIFVRSEFPSVKDFEKFRFWIVNKIESLEKILNEVKTG
jgi:hypothetical protein